MGNFYTRREFISDVSLAGLGMAGLGAFIQSCAEKDISFSKNLAELYIEGLRGIIRTISEREMPHINQAAGLAVQTKLQGHRLFAGLKGNMINAEMRENRPGNPNLFILGDVQRAARDDFVLTNDPDSARGLKERLVKVVGFTSPSVLSTRTPPGGLDNMGGFRLEDVSNIVIYCHVPHTDGIVNVEGIDVPLFPASGIVHSAMYYAIVSDIIEGLAKHGVYYNVG